VAAADIYCLCLGFIWCSGGDDGIVVAADVLV
jgi:hypothetical protein